LTNPQAIKIKEEATMEVLTVRCMHGSMNISALSPISANRIGTTPIQGQLNPPLPLPHLRIGSPVLLPLLLLPLGEELVNFRLMVLFSQPNI